MALWLTAIFCFALTLTRALSRDVPALDDLCTRGSWSFCPGANQAAAPAQAAQPSGRLPAADMAPMVSSPDRPLSDRSNGRPASSISEYCSQFEPHFMYFCGDDESKAKRAGDFCQDYLTHCVLKSEKRDQPQPPENQQVATKPPPLLVPCSSYRPQFTRSCSQVVSNPQTAQFCQTYQTYCMKGATSPPPPSVTPQPPALMAMDKIKDKCSEFKTAAKLYCTGPVVKVESSQTKQYCDMFRTYCVATGFATLT